MHRSQNTFLWYIEVYHSIVKSLMLDLNQIALNIMFKSLLKTLQNFTYYAPSCFHYVCLLVSECTIISPQQMTVLLESINLGAMHNAFDHLIFLFMFHPSLTALSGSIDHAIKLCILKYLLIYDSGQCIGLQCFYFTAIYPYYTPN